MKKLFLTSAISTLLLSACGGTDQDSGSVENANQRFSGLAIDGYLARATVFLDTNNDGTRNAWEPFAFTDNDGYFSHNPLTDTDYCAANASTEQQQYCLVSNIKYSNVVIRIDSGYDVMTGEPFSGQMSRRVTPDGENSENVIVSPISSLLTSIESTEEQSSVLSSLGLESSDLNVDYLNTDGAGAVDSSILNAALKVHKVVSVLSDRLTDTYDEIGDDFGTPNDASSSVYPQLAQQLLNSSTSFDLTVQDTTHLASVLDGAEAELREVYERKEFTLPADMGNATNINNFSRIIDVANNVVSVVNTLIDPNVNNLQQDDVIGQTRAIETVVIKALNETSNDITIENVVEFFTEDTNQVLVDGLLDSLSLDTADIISLSNNDFSGSDFDSVSEIMDIAALPESAEAFSQIASKKIRVSDLDLGSAPSNLDDSEIEFYFAGDTTSIDGSFTACVKYIDNAKSDGTLGEGNTRGELVDGFWSLLGATTEDNESYSLLLTITFLGTTYQGILKPNGLEMIDNTLYQRIRFDNNDDISNWHSEQGFEDIVSIPTTNAECEARLPSRIGI